MSLILTPLKGIPLIHPGNDLGGIILSGLEANQIDLEDNDLLVLGQKIVSKAEGRLVDLNTIQPGRTASELASQCEKDPRLVELILRESKSVLRVRPGSMIVEHRLGFICASAGIDHSNVRGESGGAEDWVLLLPEDPDRSALEIRRKIESATDARIGVMVIDSHGRPWRLGVVGTCIGLSGLPALIDERGWVDLFGYRLKITLVAAADELAAAASLVMGEASEGTPIVHARGFPYPLRESSLQELLRPKDRDMFR